MKECDGNIVKFLSLPSRTQHNTNRHASRSRDGRWVFLAPIGYLNAPRAMGKSLMQDPERAPLVRRAFEKYATSRFSKEQLLKQAGAWGLTTRRGRPLTSQAMGMLPRNQPVCLHLFDVPEYAGTDHLTVQSAASRRLVPSLTSGSARSGWHAARPRTR